MKKTIAICFLMAIFNSSWAAKYYLSAAGSDTNTGTSSSAPWQTITKLNTVFYSAGDSVFFNRGDVFRGTIIVVQSGTASNNIVFSAYGTGLNPVISGAIAVSNWTLTGPATYGTIYQANFSVTPTMFYVNQHEKIVARYPNNRRYLYYDSSHFSQLFDQSLLSIGTATVNNSKVCIHTRQWCWEKTTIASVTGSTAVFTGTVQQKGLPKYAYFLYDNLLHLDTIGEWKYDATTQKINFVLPVGQTPTVMTCEASVSSYSNGVEFSPNAKHITFKNLSFEKQSNTGVLMNNSGNQYIKIDNCSFSGQYYYGVHDRGRYNEISNCYFREVDGLGIYLSSPGRKSTIHHNTFRNIGEFRNSGFGLQYNLSAIHNSFIDSCYIHHNDIDSTGYCGISCDGAHNLIERNIIKNAMMCNNDGAALKSWGPLAIDNTFKDNFVIGCNGNTEGTFMADFKTPGIYFDFLVNNCKVYNNTIYNHNGRGIFQNAGNINNAIISNVVYGTDYCLDLNGTQAQTVAISGMTIKRNAFFALSPTAINIKQLDAINNYSVAQGYIDSNYCFQPYNAANVAFRMIGNTTPTYYNFAAWQATGNDLKSKKSFVSWVLPTNNSTLFTNMTDNITTLSLIGSYFDLDSNLVCNSLTLQPYSSKILISTTQPCLSAINENTMKQITSDVYPNPAQNYVTVKFNDTEQGIVNVSLLDITGKQLKSVYTNSDEFRLKFEDIPNGFYLVRISNSKNQSEIHKIIINN